MAKTSSGVYQLPNGTWGFRYAFWVDGKQKDIKRTTDENGNPFTAHTSNLVPFCILKKDVNLRKDGKFIFTSEGYIHE